MNLYRTAILAALLLLAPAALLAQDDIARHRSCSECGMDRKQYGYSRMLIEYPDGAEVGTCSLHCAAEVLERTKDKSPKAVRAADRDSRELVAAEQAAWVVGGKKKGVMTEAPKWAFGTKGAAEAFVKANGGKIVPWAEALEAAKKETH